MRKNLLPAAALALALGVSACETDLAGINDNPNDPTDVSASYILPEAQRRAVEEVFGRSLNMDHASLFAQHFALIAYPNEDRYIVGDAAFAWSDLYTDALKEFQKIIEKGQESETANHEAVGRIMTAWTYHVMTDLWGDIPYSAALKADAEEEDNTPAYDPQSDIYAGVLDELETGAGLLDPNGTTFGTEDLIYHGDVAKWQKFANSLRMRLAMHMSAADPTNARAEFEAAYNTSAYISDNADNATLVYPGSAPNENPFYEDKHRSARDDHAISRTLTDVLNAWSDPRLKVYADPTEADSTVYSGALNGLIQQPNDGAEISRIGKYWRDTPTAPFVLLSAAEVHFLLAEAAQHSWTVTGSAQSHYEMGIRASMKQYGIADADIDAYLVRPGVAWGTDDPYKQIATQKWIALYGNGMEAWSEYRRTGYPVLTPGADAELTEVPSRLRYPSIEQSLNGANWQAAIDRQGPNTLTTRVWWDRN